MKKVKKNQLESRGWRVGTAAEFLDLSPEEAALVEIKLALADSLRQLRAELELTQEQVAKKLQSSQSRVAKMEAADPSVSVDLLLRSLLAMGRTRQEVAHVLAS